MKTRVISGIAMLPLLLIVAAGGYILAFACLLLAIGALREFFNGFHSIDIKPSMTIATVSTIILYGAVMLFGWITVKQDYVSAADPAAPLSVKWLLMGTMIWMFISMIMCLLYLFRIEKRKLEDGMATITGIFYITFFSAHLVLIDFCYTERTGNYFSFDGMSGFFGNPVWLVLITAFCSDIFAYFTGYFLGKHKLCPVISPKKTIEGAVGGVVGTVAVSALFGYYCLSSEHLLAWIIIGFAGSVMSMFGDLTASIFKRKMGIKDYGKLIPGHGGVMDRIDSVLFTAPVVFYCIMIYNLFVTV